MAVLPSTGALHYNNCCIDRGTSPEYFGKTLIHNNEKKERKKERKKEKLGYAGRVSKKIILPDITRLSTSYSTFISFPFTFLLPCCHLKNSQPSFGWTISNKGPLAPWNYYVMRSNTHKFINRVPLCMILCYVRSLYTYETQRCFRNCVLFFYERGWNCILATRT
jgi:hypothetical protein